MSDLGALVAVKSSGSRRNTRGLRKARLSPQEVIRTSLGSLDCFADALTVLARRGLRRQLGRLVYEATRDNEVHRQLVSRYFEQATELLTLARDKSETTRLKRVCSAVKHLGLGELVFVAPEGPHAAAGGIAQVITGLLGALSDESMPVTLIAPLYENELPGKHLSAETILHEGLLVQGKRIFPKYSGEIAIHLGGTKRFATEQVLRPLEELTAKLYTAELRNMRFLFLRQADAFCSLYPELDAFGRLRQAVALSRGALEAMCSETVTISPHIVISNDWLTALVPALLKTDSRYRLHPRLAAVETAHVLHNCGHLYQGCFETVQHGEDLWPLLKLDGVHYEGLSAPTNRKLLNLTAGAVFHTTKALLAVSRPYARELLSPESGEGLHELFQRRRDILFGISNGIDARAIRSSLFGRDGGRGRVKRSAALLPTHKQRAKAAVQERYGLETDENAVLISFVGRLAEQKGVYLLTEEIPEFRCSLLERALVAYPSLQFVIAGPPSDSPQAIAGFARALAGLAQRFPRRIVYRLQYVPHVDALQITAASDLFLMPSRYEPGGITQLEALATGTIVVARNVGGISATLTDYNDQSGTGNAFLFNEYSPRALWNALERAMTTMGKPERCEGIRVEAAGARNDWRDRVPHYLALFQHAAGILSPRQAYPHFMLLGALMKGMEP